MILLIDNYDSFTYNLYQYLRALGQNVLVRRNDEIGLEEIEKLAPSLIVISPGPGSPRDTGICLDLIRRYHKSLPILGICLGMQTIAEHFGGRVVEAEEPVHGKLRKVWHVSEGLFRGLPNPLTVTRYHSLIVEIDSLPDELEVTAHSEIGEVMGLRHKVYPVCGVQFHPEAYLTEHGLDLLRNALPLSHD